MPIDVAGLTAAAGRDVRTLAGRWTSQIVTMMEDGMTRALKEHRTSAVVNLGPSGGKLPAATLDPSWNYSELSDQALRRAILDAVAKLNRENPLLDVSWDESTGYTVVARVG